MKVKAGTLVKIYLSNNTTIEGIVTKWKKSKIILTSLNGGKLTLTQPKLITMVQELKKIEKEDRIPITKTPSPQSVVVMVGQIWQHIDGTIWEITDQINGSCTLENVKDKSVYYISNYELSSPKWVLIQNIKENLTPAKSGLDLDLPDLPIEDAMELPLDPRDRAKKLIELRLLKADHDKKIVRNKLRTFTPSITELNTKDKYELPNVPGLGAPLGSPKEAS